MANISRMKIKDALFIKKSCILEIWTMTQTEEQLNILYLVVNVFETSWRIYIEIFLDFINDIITVEITIWTKTYVFVV